MGKIFFLPLAFLTCNVILQCTPGWWNGRHKGLKIPRFIRAGSSPAPGTTFTLEFYIFAPNLPHTSCKSLFYVLSYVVTCQKEWSRHEIKL